MWPAAASAASRRGDLDPLALRRLAHVEPHARAHEPVERQLVDRARPLAAGGGEVVLRRVDVRARVGDQRDGLRRPAQAVGQVGDLAAEDLREQRRGVARGPRRRSWAAAARPGPARWGRTGRRSSRRLQVGEVRVEVHRAGRRGSTRARRRRRSGSAPAGRAGARSARRPRSPSAPRGARTGTRRSAATRPPARAPPARTFAYSLRVAGVIAPRSTSTLPSASS